VVAGFLLKQGIVNDVKEAVAFIKTKRPGIGLHPKQLAILEKFAQSCV